MELRSTSSVKPCATGGEVGPSVAGGGSVGCGGLGTLVGRLIFTQPVANKTTRSGMTNFTGFIELPCFPLLTVD